MSLENKHVPKAMHLRFTKRNTFFNYIKKYMKSMVLIFTRKITDIINKKKEKKRQSFEKGPLPVVKGEKILFII